MSECTSIQQITKRQVIIQMSGTIIGILLAKVIEHQGYPIIGWGIAGLLISLGILFAYKAPGNRWNLKNISIIILTNI